MIGVTLSAKLLHYWQVILKFALNISWNVVCLLLIFDVSKGLHEQRYGHFWFIADSDTDTDGDFSTEGFVSSLSVQFTSGGIVIGRCKLFNNLWSCGIVFLFL